jgi:hypothetical protein
MKHYSPTGRRNHGRTLKRLLDTWDRNGTTSGPTACQIYEDDDNEDTIAEVRSLNTHRHENEKPYSLIFSWEFCNLFMHWHGHHLVFLFRNNSHALRFCGLAWSVYLNGVQTENADSFHRCDFHR